MEKKILMAICEIATSDMDLSELSKMLNQKAEWMKTRGLSLVRIGRILCELSSDIRLVLNYLNNIDKARDEKKL